MTESVVPFWIICTETDPGRFQVPVDAGSDVVRPCDSLAWQIESTGHVAPCQDPLLEKLSKASPVNLVDATLRSNSMCSTVGTDRMTSDLDLCSLDMYSSDVGLCYSSRSEESVEGLFTGMELFDSLMKDNLPRLKILPATVGLVRQVSFDVPAAPHREGAEDKAFGRTCETVEKAMSFDLKRVISRFRRDMKSKARSNPTCEKQQREETKGFASDMFPEAKEQQQEEEQKAPLVDQTKYTDDDDDTTTSTTTTTNKNNKNGMMMASNESRTLPRDTQAVEKELVDFMFMVPR